MEAGKGSFSGNSNRAQAVGRMGEDYTAGWLETQGWHILERNWRCPLGEIDIIARKGGVVVFVEVKTRSQGYWASPLEAIGKRKQEKLLKTALLWVERAGSGDQPRFDAASVVMDRAGRILSFEYIESAFDGSGMV